MLRTRGLAGFLCVALLVAFAMAPLATGWCCGVLVALPSLFGIAFSAPLDQAPTVSLPSVSGSSPLVQRPPPLA